MTARKVRLTTALVALGLVSGCTVELQHDLAEDDANDIYVLLESKGIDAKKLKDEGGNEPRYIISVAKGDVGAAAQLMRERSLPRPKADGLGIFKKSKGMIPTQTEERAMFIEALAGEVSNALNRVPRVLEARTIVMIPEVNDLTQPDKKPQPSASVFIKYAPPKDGEETGGPPLTEDQVKSFVAASVPEMSVKTVNVLWAEAEKPTSDTGDALMQTVLGLRMAKGSANQFKMMAALTALLVLGMAGFTTWNFMRSSMGGGKSRPGRKPPPGAEA